MDIINKAWNLVILKRKQVNYGPGLDIRGRIFVHGRKGGITIGKSCKIFSSENVNPTSGMNHTHLTVGSEGKLRIGDHVGMSHVCVTAYREVIIEDYVLLGSGVKIWDTDFHSLDYETRIHGNDQGLAKPIRIGEGAFIGACSILLKGATVGKHSVIGAGSVVTGAVPDDEVWAGNPARFIRKLEE